MLEGGRMSELAGKTLTEDQVLLIAKALGDRRRYETCCPTMPRASWMSGDLDRFGNTQQLGAKNDSDD
jgi:hypothetical protein